MRNRGNRTVTRWVWACMCTASFLAGTAAWAFARPLHLKLVDASGANLPGATIIASSEASKPMTAAMKADGTYSLNIAGSKISLVVQQPAMGEKQTVQFALTDLPPGQGPVSVKLRYNGQSLTRIMPNNTKSAAPAAPVSLGTLSGFISTRKATPGAGAPKISPSSIQLPPSPPAPAGAGCGVLTITQNTDPITVVTGTSASCNAAGVNTDNFYARSFDLSVGPTAGVPWTVGCVDFGVETNVLPYTVTVNIYQDTNGGAPEDLAGDLVLLGTQNLLIPDATALTVVTADFTAQGIVLPANATIVFEVFTPDRQTINGGDGGSFFVGSNSAGQSGPTYIKAADCTLPTYTDTAAIGFPLMHWVMRVDLNSTGPITGACCDDATGICMDNVLITDCLGRFAANTLCANLNPPCGVVLGACCMPDGTCSLTEQANCTGTWLGANTSCADCPLVNDNCAGASAIAGAGTFNFDNSTATTDGLPDPLCFSFGTDQIDNDVWFCWTDPACAGSDVTITTVGLTAVDTRIAVYDGCTCPPTLILACNDDDPNDGLQSTVTFPAAAGPYLIRIGTFPGTAGGAGQFSITCAAPPPPVGPPNDLCADAICVADGTPFSGSTVNATGTDISSCGFGDDLDVWHIYTPGVSGPATISLCGSLFDTTLSIFDACGGLELACNDDSCGLQSEITALNLTAGTPILIRVSGYGGGTGDYTLTVTGGAGTCGACPAGGTGDECTAPIVVGEGTFAGDTTDNTGTTGDDTSCGFGDTIDEWYCYTATCTGTATASTCNTAAFDTTLGVFDACGGLEIACNDDGVGCAAFTSEVTWPVTAGVSYFVRVSGFGDAVGTYTLNITCQAGPPPQGVCTQPAANCQAGDLSNANTSDVVGFVVADDFNCPAPGSITSICWWGTYASGVPSLDSFTVTYYDDAGGLPGNVIGGPFTGAGLTVSGPVDTGMIIAGLVPEFEYTATHAAVPVIGACYWVSVSNALASGDTWFWEFGLGNGRAMQDGLPAGVPNGFDAGDLIQNDLKWCLDLALGDPTACLPPPAANDACANAEAIVGEGTFPFDNSAATTDGVPDLLCDFFAAQQIDSDVWFCWTAPCTSDVRLETCNLTAVDTKIAVYDGCTCPSGLGILACNDDDCSLQSGLVFSAVMGQTYLIRIGTFPGAAGGLGSFSLTCIQLPANDLCADAIGPLAVPSTTAGTTALATIDSGFPSPCGTASITSPGVWYTVLGTGNTMTASLCNGATAFDSKLSIFCRGCGAAICVDGNDDFCGLQSEVSWCSQAGVEYLVLVHGFGGASGPFELVLTDDGTACAGAVQCIVEPTGACCAADGTCTLQTASGCAALGGAFLGGGTDCGSESTVGSATSAPGIAIPDNDPIGVSDTLTMGMSFPIQDVNISLDVTHTWVGDLIVTVDHLGMTAVTIVDQPGVPTSTFGCSEDNYNIVLDDEGTGGAIEDQCAPGLSSPPNYTPSNPLSAFDGMDSAGAWTITVSDNAGGDTGTLDAWTVTFTQPGVNPCGVVGACCVGTTCTIETDTNCAAIGGAFQGAGTDCGGLVVVASPTSTPAVAIPDSDPLGVSDTLAMGMSIPIEIVQLNLVATHTWVGDLIFTVEHLGTSVTIVDRPGVPASSFGCSEDNYNIVLDDAGTGGAIEDQCAPDLTSPPNYTPNNPLSAFAGMDSAGDWTITVSDNAGGDTGTLDSWSVIFLQSSGGPCAGPTCTPADCPAGSIPLVDGVTGVFSGWCVTPSNPGDVDIFVDTVDLANSLVSIEITKSFRNPPDANGLISPILLNFVQVCDDADTVNMIVIAEEAVNNQTGVAWTDYHWTMFTSPVTWFDVGASAGFSVAPFTDAVFNNFLDPPTNNQAKGLDASGGGTVPSPGAFFPGFGTGGLKIGVDLSGSVPVSFVLKQRPTVGAPTGACCCPAPPPGGDEGCTPGFWKNHIALWPAGFNPSDDFDTVFGVDAFDPDLTLLGALQNGGGGVNALGRHATGALLNAASPAVDFALTEAEVIAMVQAALAPGGDIEGTKDTLQGFNEMGCPEAGTHAHPPNESCVIRTQADCEAEGGTYQGDNTTCDPDPCAIITTGACCLPPVPNCLGNGSFESGDFTSWTTQDMGAPFVPLHVGGAGESPGFGLFTSAPTDGTSALLTGFDGDGPGTIRVAQDASIPAGATALLFDYRGGWDLATFGATQDRTFTVKIEPAGGGAALQTDLILTATAGTFMGDTGPLNGSVDVSAFAGSTVQVAFEWFVSENFSGPAFFQLDNVRCDLSGSPCQDLTAADCLAAGGVFQGDGVPCTPNPCLPPPPPGACCVNGVCTMTATVDDCTAAGGTFQGPGTSCATCFVCGVPPLSNDLCAGAIPVAVPSQTEGTTVGATLDGVPFCGASETSPSVWYSVTGTGNTMTATTCNSCSDFDTKLSVFCAGCGVLNCVDGNDDNCTGFSGLLSTVSWCSEAGTEYLILVHGFGGAEGNFRLDVSDDGAPCATPPSCAPPPMCAADFVVTAPGIWTGDTTGAGNDCDLRTSEDHIYEVTLPNAGTWTISLCGSAFDTVLHLGTTCCSADIAINDDFCSLQSEITMTLPAGTVWVTVEGFSGAGAYTLNISKQAPPQSNDDCVNATPLTGIGQFAFDNSLATTDGPPDVLCDSFGSQQVDNDVWFCWTATCTGSATVDACGLTAVDTKMAAYDGCVCPPTTILACNDDTCGLQSQLTFPVIAGQPYLLRIGTFPGAAGGTGSILITCTAGGVQSTPSFTSPGLDIKPGIAPNPFAAQSNGVLPVGILGTADFNVTTVNVASLRIARLDGTGGLVAPYQDAVGPQTAIGEIGTPDGFADLSVYFKTAELAGALKLGTLPVGTTVPLIITGSRIDGTVFKVVDSIVTAPLTKGRKFVTVTSSVAGAWLDAGSLDTNADAGGFASFVRCYGDQSYVTTFTAPAAAGGRAFRNWVLDGVVQPLGLRTIQVPLNGDHTVRAQYLIRRPRRLPHEIERLGINPMRPPR